MLVFITLVYFVITITGLLGFDLLFLPRLLGDLHTCRAIHLFGRIQHSGQEVVEDSSTTFDPDLLVSSLRNDQEQRYYSGYHQESTGNVLMDTDGSAV